MELKIVMVDERDAFKHVWEVDDVVKIEVGGSEMDGVYRVVHVKGECYGSSGMQWTYELGPAEERVL